MDDIDHIDDIDDTDYTGIAVATACDPLSGGPMRIIERLKPYEAKKALTSVINRVAYGRETIIFESRGKDLAALVPMEDYRLLERLTGALEDRVDIEEAERALEASTGRDRADWAALKEELGLAD